MDVTEELGAKMLRTLVELWCDQYHQEIISLEITKKEKSDEKKQPVA